MALLGTLQVRMGLDAAAFRKGFTSFQKDLKKGVGRFQRSMSGLTSVGSLGGGLAAGLGLKDLIRTAGDFEASMNGVRAVMAGLSAGEFTELQNKAKELGKTTRFSAIESAGAIEVLAKNGLKVEDIMGGALDASLLLAASTGSEIPEAADLATDAMLIFGKSATDLGDVVNRVNGVMINSKFGFEDYRNALATGGPAAVKAGKSLEEFNATIGATASFFASGESAGTAFKVFTDRLVTDTKAATEAQEQLGISFFDTEGNMKSMIEIAGGLQKGLAGLTDEEAIKSLTSLFGTRGANFAVALARAGAAGIENQKALQGQADAAKQAEIRMEGLAGVTKKLTSALEGLKIQLAEGGLLGAVTKFLSKATEFTGWLGNLPEPVLNAGIAIAALVAAAGPLAFGLTSIAGVIPVITGALGGMASGLLALTGPVGLVVAALAGAAVLIVKNWDAVKAAVLNLVNAIVGYFQRWAADNRELLLGIAEKWNGFKEAIVNVWNALAPRISQAIDVIVIALDKFLKPIGGLQGAWEIFSDTVSKVLTVIGDLIGTVFEVAAVVLNNFADVLNGQKSIWAGLREAAVESVKAIIEFVKRNFGSLIDFFSALGDKMLEAGMNLMIGLANGIRDAAMVPVNAVKDVGNSIVSMVTGIFGIESPSKVFKRFGGYLMEGLGIGIDDKKPAAEAAMKDAAASVIEAGRAGLGDEVGAGKLLEVGEGQAEETKAVFGDVFSNFENRLGQAITSGKNGFKQLGDSLIAEVSQRALRTVIADISSGLGGLFGGSSGGFLGSIGSALGGLFGGLPSFEGGGYTGSASRSGGIDGRGGFLSILHPQEMVIDETRMARASTGGSAGGVTVHNHFNIAPGVTREELNTVMEEAEIQRQREELRRYRDGDPTMAQFVY